MRVGVENLSYIWSSSLQCICQKSSTKFEFTWGWNGRGFCCTAFLRAGVAGPFLLIYSVSKCYGHKLAYVAYKFDSLMLL